MLLLDWEYPSADDRGGVPADADNYVVLVAELREAFNAENPAWTITVTLPTSYWYLRGFAVESMQKYVSWFNLMSYDLHGMWDHDNTWTGPYLMGHTNIQEIDLGLDLLWRNNIDPKNVVFGMAFYGRSFTMADPNCHEPNGACEFSTGGQAGTCSDTVGILTYQEISARNTTLDVHTFYDFNTTVKYNIYNGDQWVSYDDEQSWTDKKDFVSKRCLSGIMVWALDQDNAAMDAYDGLMGDTSVLELEGGGLSPEELAALADQFAAYTGQNCFVTPTCTDGSSGQLGPDQVCPGGTQSVSTAHTPKQAAGHDYHGECSTGWYRHICCPKDALPQNCAWNGAPERSEFGCEGSCGSSQFTLNTDSYLDAKGEGNCYTGTRSLCCDSTEVISECYWSPCQGPISLPPTCNDGYTYQGYRLDKPDGSEWCSDTYVSPVDGSIGSPVHQSFKSALCCPTDSAFTDCSWSNNPTVSGANNLDLICLPQACPAGQVKIGDALDPEPSPQLGAGELGTYTPENACDGVVAPVGQDMHFPLCCSPQSKYNKKWPIDPKDLFAIYYDDPTSSDVLWTYSDEVTNNDKDDSSSSKEDGTDAYGFLMLDGPPGSIDNSFSTTNTIVRQTAAIPNVKRSIVTHNQTVMDAVFEHTEEVLHIYCNHPPGSAACEEIWIDGAEDTIIRMPDHVGEGPFARIVSMKPVTHDLPQHHLEHRSEEGLQDNPVYEVVVDYNFGAISITQKRADNPVFLRVDYTNLLGYWDEVEAAEPNSKRRRAATMPDWHSRVKRAVTRDSVLRKRDAPINITSPMYPIGQGSNDVECNDDVLDQGNNGKDKRWWGAIGAWIKKMTTIEKSDLGVLPLEWEDTVNLFSARWGCPGQTLTATLDMDLEANINMDATYAYYFSAAFIPPATPEVYAYLGMEPTAYVGLKLTGNAVMQYTSGRKKIIDTLSYPGLAVKGIAAVGPTLDVYGEIRGKITLRGSASAGAQLSFGKAEVYWPQDDAASAQYQQLVGLDSKSEVPSPEALAPVFEAGVQINAQLDVIVTPQANIGVKIGGGSLVSTTIMDAQLSGYVMGDLSFQASGDVSTTTGAFIYSYGVYAIYNLGYTAKATILGIVNWALDDRKAYNPDKHINIYGPVTGSIPLTKKRSLEEDDSLNITSSIPRLANRQTGSDDDTSPNSPDFTQNLQCPAGSGEYKRPELRFNCDLLGSVQVLSTDGISSVLVKGMCDGWKSMNQRPEFLTYSGDTTRAGERRGEQCPTGYCSDIQAELNEETGRSPSLQCDEAPWAASEEGGNFLNDADRAQTCVSAYSNGAWGGSCQKMVRDLTSNWGKLDDSIPADQQVDNWVPWTDAAWTRAGAVGVNTQEPKTYPTNMPQPDGMPTRPDDQTSWKFRREFTWSIVDNTASASQWWDATGWTYSNPKYTGATYAAGTGLDSILCAVNNFGQDDVVKMAGAGRAYNGYCLRGPRYTTQGWQDVWHVTKCVVTFGAPVTTKRDVGASEATEEKWEVKNVEYLEDDPEDPEEDGFFVVTAPNRSTKADGSNLPGSSPPFEEIQSIPLEHEVLVRKTSGLEIHFPEG